MILDEKLAIEKSVRRTDDIAAIVREELEKKERALYEEYDKPKTEAQKMMLEMKQKALTDQEYRESFRKSTGFDILTGEKFNRDDDPAIQKEKKKSKDEWWEYSEHPPHD